MRPGVWCLDGSCLYLLAFLIRFGPFYLGGFRVQGLKGLGFRV